MMRLLLATTNRGKRREIGELLAGLPIELVTLDAWPEISPPEETGATFAENARLKASYYAAQTGELVVAEDSGLEVDAMGGAPGVHSARFGGEESSYPDKFELIYAALARAPQLPRTARFVCALALADPAGVRFEASGTVEGEIEPAPRGTGGFGYDPIFFYPPFNATLAEAAARKGEVSHRARAFAQLRNYLETRD